MKRIARHFLEPRFSGLWVASTMIFAFFARDLGPWWLLWYALSAVPITVLEVWWERQQGDDP